MGWGGWAMREKGAWISRWTSEWSVKCEGGGKTEQEDGGRTRGEGVMVSQWSRHPPLRGKVGMGLCRGWRCDSSSEVKAGLPVPFCGGRLEVPSPKDAVVRVVISQAEASRCDFSI